MLTRFDNFLQVLLDAPDVGSQVQKLQVETVLSMSFASNASRIFPQSLLPRACAPTKHSPLT